MHPLRVKPLPALSAVCLATLLLFALVPVEVHAQTARSEFEEAARLTREGRRAEALTHFQRSRELEERPVTVFNIMETLAALGRSREAMIELERFLEIADAEEFAAERATAESRRLVLLETLVHITLEIEPADATLSVDGEVVSGTGRARTFYLDPGAHSLRVSAEGYAEVTRELAADENDLAIALTALPTTLVLRSALPDAEIQVDGEVVGRGSAELTVPAGEHLVRVTAPARETFQRSVTTSPGERLVIDATLPSITQPAQARPLWKSPILWTVVGVVVVGSVATGVYFGTRGPPPLQGTTGVTLGALHAF